MRRALPVVVLLALGGVSAAPAQAAAPPDIVVWVGPTAPGTALRGVHLRPDGKGELLAVRAAARRSGATRSAGRITAAGARLKAIRSAAKALYGRSGVRVIAPGGEMYASAVITIGSGQRATLELGAASPRTAALLRALNAVLPAGRALPVPVTTPPVAAAALADAAAKCPAGQRASSAAREISLKDAAKAGMVKLTAKGPLGGDSMAVDAVWKPVDGPVKVTVNIELVDSGPSAAEPSPGQVEQAIESTLEDRLSYQGHPIKVDAVVVRRSSTDSPTPCFHQIYFYPDTGVRDYVDGLDGLTNPLPQGGQWNYGGADDARSWAHETMHLLGVDDQYRDYLTLKDGTEIQVPSTVNSEDAKVLKQWASQQGLDVNDAVLHSVPNKGHEKDLMGDTSVADFTIPSALLTGLYAASAKRAVIHADPGDILLNKNPANQNLGVGAPFDFTVSPGKPAHVDGMVAYCLDLGRHPPNAGGTLDVFDVLGNAVQRPEASMHALAAVLDEVAARRPRPLAPPPGANDAVWRITDELTSLGDAARSILAAAGVAVDASVSYGAPHFANPNAAAPGTASVSDTGVDPTVEPDPALAAALERQAKLPAARLTALRVIQRSVRRPRRGRALLGIEAELTGRPATLRLRIHRAGRRKALRTITRRLAVGATSFSVALPRLPAGAYELRAGRRSARFRLG